MYVVPPLGVSYDLLRKCTAQALHEQMEDIQRNWPGTEANYSDKKSEESMGSNLVTLSEMTATFLEAAFLGTKTNKDCKKWVNKIGVPDCD